jgi:predicted MFS family arabinose efflux permease
LLLPPIGLAVLVWSDQVQVWHVVLAEFLRGAVLAIDQPAKQAAIVDMTGKEDVSSAIALWSSAISVTRIVGPAVAGALVAWVGEGLCFFLNGVSYLALVVALLAIHLPNPQPSARRPTLTRSLLDGLHYLAQERLLVAVVSLALVAGVFVRPFQTLLPVFARDVLAVGATGLGFLTAAAGGGAVLGALGAASLHVHRYRPAALAASLALPFAAAGFALTRSLVLSCVLLLGVGFCITALETVANSLTLVEVKDEFRGRVISLYTAASMGAPRVGGLQAGWLAGLWGAPLALALGAAIFLVYSASLAWLLRGKVRRIA